MRSIDWSYAHAPFDAAVIGRSPGDRGSQRRRRGAAAERSAQARRSIPPLDAEQLIAAAAGTRFGPLIVFDFSTGLRRGELAGLKWADIDFERRTATIRGAVAQIPKRTWYKSTKTDLVATIALSKLALDALRSQRALQAKEPLAAGAVYDDLGFVFAPPGGGMPTPASLGQGVRRIAECAGL